jgi:hypothetical protein
MRVILIFENSIDQEMTHKKMGRRAKIGGYGGKRYTVTFFKGNTSPAQMQQ